MDKRTLTVVTQLTVDTLDAATVDKRTLTVDTQLTVGTLDDTTVDTQPTADTLVTLIFKSDNYEDRAAN